MLVTVEPTCELFEIKGLQCRLWVGKTSTGKDVNLLVQSLRPPSDASEEEAKSLGDEFKASIENVMSANLDRSDWLHLTGCIKEGEE